MAQQTIIAFDLVGPMLDLHALEAKFRAEFGGKQIKRPEMVV